MMDTYTVENTGGARPRSIITPHAHDVLLGRGGGINAHEGNRIFREWVRQRKNQYSLALHKSEKARVAKEVVNLVKSLNPPGRFLQRDPSTGTSCIGWWIEVNEAKAMAKTSQALREGAPQIRAAAQNSRQSDKQSPKLQLITPSHPVASTNQAKIEQAQQAGTLKPAQVSPVHTASKFSSLATTSLLQKFSASTISQSHEINSQHSLIQLLVPGVDEFDGTYARPTKRAMGENESHALSTQLKRAKMEDRQKVNIIEFEGEMLPSTPVPAEVDIVPQLTVCVPVPRRVGLSRVSSFALSDISEDWTPDEEFVNPFEDEIKFESRHFPSNV